jgi:hypothetical protein
MLIKSTVCFVLLASNWLGLNPNMSAVLSELAATTLDVAASIDRTSAVLPDGKQDQSQ